MRGAGTRTWPPRFVRHRGGQPAREEAPVSPGYAPVTPAGATITLTAAARIDAGDPLDRRRAGAGARRNRSRGSRRMSASRRTTPSPARRDRRWSPGSASTRVCRRGR